MSKTPLRILVFPPPDDGCTWYRQRLWVDVASKRDGVVIKELREDIPDQEVGMLLANSDVLFLRASNEGNAKLMQMLRVQQPHLGVVGDTDDDMLDIHPTNNSYEAMGTTEVKLPDGRWLWKDLQPGFSILENRKRATEYAYVLEFLDAVTTTSPRLATRLQEYNTNTVVIPNAIQPKHFPYPIHDTDKPKDEVRLLWSGGSSHHDDLALVKPALQEVLKRFPQVHLYTAGQVFPGFVKDFPEDRMHALGWIKSDGHGYRLSTLDADIGLCPLVENKFNAAKSCVKWYEYSALGLATVASKTAPYADEIVNAKTGLLATPKEFGRAVEQLVADTIYRKQLGNAAREWVIKNRNIETVADDWLAVMQAVKDDKQGGT